MHLPCLKPACIVGFIKDVPGSTQTNPSDSPASLTPLARFAQRDSIDSIDSSNLVMDATGNYENREIRRVSMACTVCRARKLKCRKLEKNSPSCERCIKDGQECIFVPVSEDMSHSQRHDRIGSLPNNVPPPFHYHPGVYPPQQHANAPHVLPQAPHWPVQSSPRSDDAQQAQQAQQAHHYHDQSDAESSRYIRYSPYQQEQAMGVVQPSAHYTSYTRANAWSVVQPTSYDQFVPSSNSAPNAVPSSAENYSSAYLSPFSQNNAMYTVQGADPSHVYQTYPESNLAVFENLSGYDTSGEYESPNHAYQDSTSESNE